MIILEVAWATIQELFAIYLDGLPRHIREIVFFQAAAILVVSICVLALLIARLFWQSRMRHYRKHFSMLVVNEVLNFTMEEKCVSLLHKARSRANFIMNEALRVAILENLYILVGAERIFLAEKYVELGFADQDLRQCDSIYWWKRLKATSAIGNLGLPQFAPRLYDLIRDRNQYVSIAARIGLSNTRHPLNSAALLKNLPIVLLERGNALTAIAHNLAEIQGVDVIKDFLHSSNPAVLRESCLTAIIAVKSDASITIVFDLLNYPAMLTANMITRCLVFLRKLDDPSQKNLVSQFLRHPALTVRLEVAHWFLHFLDDETASKFNRLGSDLDEVLSQLAAQPLLGESDLPLQFTPAVEVAATPVNSGTPMPPPTLTSFQGESPNLAPPRPLPLSPANAAVASLTAPIAPPTPDSYPVQVAASIATSVSTPASPPTLVSIAEIAAGAMAASQLTGDAALLNAVNAALLDAINAAVNAAVSNVINLAIQNSALGTMSDDGANLLNHELQKAFANMGGVASGMTVGMTSGMVRSALATVSPVAPAAPPAPTTMPTDSATVSAISQAINSTNDQTLHDAATRDLETALKNAINNSGEAA